MFSGFISAPLFIRLWLTGSKTKHTKHLTQVDGNQSTLEPSSGRIGKPFSPAVVDASGCTPCLTCGGVDVGPRDVLLDAHLVHAALLLGGVVRVGPKSLDAPLQPAMDSQVNMIPSLTIQFCMGHQEFLHHPT